MSTYKGFTTVELRKPKRSLFDKSHERRLTMKMGKLVPIFIEETMPNDTFKVSTEVMMRMAPMIAPIMHRVNVFVHYFFVPNRLLWTEWELFITGGRLGTETPPIPPRASIPAVLGLAANALDKSSLMDYMGLPPIPDADAASWSGRYIDLMPNAAYQKVFEDYYRDRNYEPDGHPLLPLGSGTQAMTGPAVELYYQRYRCYQNDYFTSALPWTQRGSEVLMPLQGSGVVTYLPTSKVYDSTGADPTGDTLLGSTTGQGSDLRVNKLNAAGGGADGRIENIDDVTITTSDVSINDFRRAIRLQEWLERNALGGSRYNESIWAHFNRRTSDGRLQRAEYLGGGKVVVKISEVLNSAFSKDADDAIVPPANMSGHGFVVDGVSKIRYNCEEHGFVLGIMSVMPTTAYMQGAPRMFFQRNTFLDYPWPSFAHLGEQEVYKYEIYADPTNLPADRTTAPIFGYQSRYADWKYTPSSTHGDFRDTLDFWHLTRKFGSSPSLSDSFVHFEGGMEDRIFAVSGVDNLWVYLYNSCTIVRSLPYYGTPTL